MSEPLLTRERVAQMAFEAARAQAETGTDAVNPFAPCSDAAALWNKHFSEYIKTLKPETAGAA